MSAVEDHEALAVPDAVEAGARLIAKWLGFSWDGLGEGSIAAKGFPVFTHRQFGWHFQGHKDDLRNLARDILAASHMPVGDGDYFSLLVERARQAAEKASGKFPQPNYIALKIAEEAGEVVRGAVHYAENRMEWIEVEGEIVQLLAMIIRFVTEGDLVNGIVPPLAASTGEAGR